MPDDIQIENEEWLASLDWVLENESEERAKELLKLLLDKVSPGQQLNGGAINTPYINTVSSDEEENYPGDEAIEQKIRNAIQWNATAMVANANRKHSGIGGHISTFSSALELYEVGLNHFFKGYDEDAPDIVYFQGHASPGLYSRSYVERIFDEEHLNHFRQEVQNDKGLSSYPHPRLMPDYWRFPTVSMGLAPIQAIYQARYLKYLEKRGLKEANNQKVWAFLGDGEMDEPESTGALAIAKREKLDNLIFVVNCNLQRLDGPVRGNSKVIQELEGIFKGAGWACIKLLWSREWDKLLEKDKGALVNWLNQVNDGTLQNFAQANGKVRREDFFNKQEAVKSLISDISDEELKSLMRGGHDVRKVFNAYKTAAGQEEKPTVILAQTVKGHGQGSDAGEASNVSHKQKKMAGDSLFTFRDNLEIPFSDEELGDKIPYYRFDKNSEEFEYLSERRKQLKGSLPKRKSIAKDFQLPETDIAAEFKDGSGDKEVTTTAVFVKILTALLKDQNVKDLIVPIIPDEARTFGMDALYKDAGIYAAQGQQYTPVDKGSLIYYNEDEQGVILEEGISEAGSMGSFIAAGTTHMSVPRYGIPFFVYYSMFGFQRVGDFIWAAADSRARGFLVGGISGRTSLSGEGLQHADGHSHLHALAVPNLKAYDPAFAYELAIVIKDGIKKMYREEQDIFYYLTISNQAYPMPEIPSGIDEEDILSGLYLFDGTRKRKNKEMETNLLGSGAVMTEVMEAAERLENDYDIPCNVWSITSYKELYDQMRSGSDISEKLNDKGSLFVAASDYIEALPRAVSDIIPGDFKVLGTDGFGKSDITPELRKEFQVSADDIIQTTLKYWVKNGELKKDILEK